MENITQKSEKKTNLKKSTTSQIPENPPFTSPNTYPVIGPNDFFPKISFEWKREIVPGFTRPTDLH